MGIQGMAAWESHTVKGWVNLAPLQIAEIAANKAGFNDIDVVNNDPGTQVTIKASAGSRSVTANAKTMSEAVEKLLGMFQ